MSPPTVSLAKKEPLTSTFDELPLDKEGGAELPSVITLETERRVRNLRRQNKQKRCKIVVCTITLLIIAIVAAVLTVTLMKVLHKRHRSWTVPHKNGQYTSVHVDDDKQLIHAKDNNAQNPTVVIEILHEYSRHLVAYKDVANSTCYIDRLDESFEVGYERWESYKKSGRDTKALKVISEPIEVEVLRHIGDIHIYAHCVSGNSFWVMEMEEKEITTTVRVVYV